MTGRDTADMLAISALMPSVEELADKAQEIADDLTDAEALEVGYVIRCTTIQILEKELNVVKWRGDEDGR